MLDDLNLDRAGSSVSNKTRDLKPMSRKQMLRVADRLPQAMVKVTSYASGMTRAMATASYVNRDGELPMETDEGHVLTSMDEVKENMEEWGHDFGERKNSRDTMHMVLSTPKDSDRIATHRAIRAFAGEMFASNHSYMFAIHNDTEHPHGHLIVKMRGHDGSKLDPRKQDLNRWREVFAEKGQEQGIEVDASPRLARGVGTKGGKTGNKLAAIKATERGESASFHSGLKEAVADTWGELQKTGGVTLKAWEKRSKEVTDSFRGAYQAEAKQIEKEAQNASGEERERLEMEAEKLQRFSESLPEPKSLREQSVEHLQSVQKSKPKDIER